MRDGEYMKCEATRTPDDVDIPALREKYRHERDKRIRSDGQKQYFKPTGAVAANYAVDPHTPIATRAPISEDIDVIILGARCPTRLRIRRQLAAPLG